jgi:hypothetical protein
VSIVTSTTTAISTVLAEYGMHGYDTFYDVTTYVTTTQDLSRNVCGNTGTQYNQYTVAPTIVEGWRLTQV